MTEHRDPASGRRYTVDAGGRSVWLDPEPRVTATPAPWLIQPQTTNPAMPVLGLPAHGRPPAAAKRRGPLVPVLAAAATGVVGLLIGVGIGGSGGTSTAATPSASTGRSRSSTPSAAATQKPRPEQTTPPALTKADYTLTVKTLSKHCFGSAGCNVEARITVATASARAVGVPVELTVQVTGDETGPTVETISVDEGGSYRAPQVYLSTRSSRTIVKATITAVEQG